MKTAMICFAFLSLVITRAAAQDTVCTTFVTETVSCNSDPYNACSSHQSLQNVIVDGSGNFGCMHPAPSPVTLNCPGGSSCPTKPRYTCKQRTTLTATRPTPPAAARGPVASEMATAAEAEAAEVAHARVMTAHATAYAVAIPAADPLERQRSSSCRGAAAITGTARFAADGRLVKEIYEPEDEEARKKASPTDWSSRPIGIIGGADFVSKGDVAAGFRRQCLSSAWDRLSRAGIRHFTGWRCGSQAANRRWGS